METGNEHVRVSGPVVQCSGGSTIVRLLRRFAWVWLGLSLLGLGSAVLIGCKWDLSYYGYTWTLEMEGGNACLTYDMDPFWIFGDGWIIGPASKPWEWALPSFQRGVILFDGTALDDGRRSIVLPLWFVAGVCACPLAAIVLFLQRAFSRVRRRRTGACLGCGYNLTGNVSGVCPECGRKLENVASPNVMKPGSPAL